VLLRLNKITLHNSNIFLTVDAVIFKKDRNLVEILLIRRGREPYKGNWALPGGFVETDEDLPDAAASELLEETGVQAGKMEQLGAFGKPGRDPRQRTVSNAFLGFADAGTAIMAGDDADRAEWFGIEDLPETAFDHAEIIASARK